MKANLLGIKKRFLIQEGKTMVIFKDGCILTKKKKKK